MDMNHLEYLQNVADEDVRCIKNKESTYKGSWKKRGGVGCFMMLCRKWDRLENMMEEDGSSGDLKAPPYDIFARIERDGAWEKQYAGCTDGHNMAIDADGTCLAEVRDLRRYLTLLEAEMMSRGVVKCPLQAKPREIPTSPPSEFGKPMVGADRERSGTPEDGGHHERQDDPEFLQNEDEWKKD